MDNKNQKLSSASFFCPAYTDVGNLPDLIPVVVNFLQRNTEKFEITIIDDGSTDGTGKVADELAQKYPNIKVIHHARNMGYNATLKEGFEKAKYDYVMYTDGDNQYDVMEFEPYLYLLQDNDVITGFATKKAVNTFRRFQSFVHNTLINVLFGTHFSDINCSMKIFKKPVLGRIKINCNQFGAFIDAELILKSKKLGFKVAQFPVTHYARKSGIASGSKPKMIWNTFTDMIKLRIGLL
ncbi:MAG: glycosyltransferase family 2 protein [Minisyncoccia bacterium]